MDWKELGPIFIGTALALITVSLLDRFVLSKIANKLEAALEV